MATAITVPTVLYTRQNTNTGVTPDSAPGANGLPAKPTAVAAKPETPKNDANPGTDGSKENNGQKPDTASTPEDPTGSEQPKPAESVESFAALKAELTKKLETLKKSKFYSVFSQDTNSDPRLTSLPGYTEFKNSAQLFAKMESELKNLTPQTIKTINTELYRKFLQT